MPVLPIWLFFVRICAQTMTDLNQNPKDQNFDKWRMASLAFDLGFIIALPLVVMGLLGKYLDGRFGTKPWLTLAGTLLAIVTTTIWLTFKFKNYFKGKE
jgi:hypothetical protein